MPTIFIGIHSGEAAARSNDGKLAGFKSADREDDFDLDSGFFTFVYDGSVDVKVFGYDDGERVARKAFSLDSLSQEFVTFGSKFNDIDEVKIKASDNPGFEIVAVDDLSLIF